MFQRLCQHTGNLLKRGQRYFCNDAKASIPCSSPSTGTPLVHERDLSWQEVFGLLTLFGVTSYVIWSKVINEVQRSKNDLTSD